MQKRYSVLLFVPLLAGGLSAQTVLTQQAYDDLKGHGALPSGPIQILSQGPTSGSPASWVTERGGGGPCGCWVAPDTSYMSAMDENDDLSSDLIALPFSFNLFGQAYDSLYINNNGNISFGTPYYTYTAEGFPSADYVMVAPFWGDVDTRDSTAGQDFLHGQVVYKVTPTALYVNWVDVGYFANMGDKRNAFQLIISDGTDPVVPGGNNVSFCYKDMQWTTGAASGGQNGFGGSPATVGVNKGDGTDHAQVGRYSLDGDGYAGPYADSSGISWLDSTHFYLNTAGANLPPIFGSTFNCDTVVVQMNAGGDHQMDLVRKLYVLPGGPGQQVVCVSDAPTLPNFVPVNAGPSEFLEIPFVIETSEADLGMHMISFTAYDPATPSLTSTYTLQVQVLAANVGIDDLAAGSQALQVLPNPANDRITVQLPAGAQAGQMEIFSADGRLEKRWSSTAVAAAVTVDVSDLGEGTYVVRMRTANNVISGRFVKLAH
jgi:hypothetical protein